MDSGIIILFASVIVIGVALITFMALTKKSFRSLDKAAYQNRWLQIEQSVGSDTGSMQFAVLQADKLLDKALKERGYAGQTMAERMSSAKSSFSNTESIWVAHKLRNRIAHEDAIQMNNRLTSQALNSFKKALKDLGAL